MKLKKYALLGVATLTLGIGIVTSPISAQATSYAYTFSKPVHHYVPRSWRGTYTRKSSTMTFSTHSIKLNGSTLYSYIKVIGQDIEISPLLECPVLDIT
ncbi:hypothetical protein [Secundilactobacillus similis]|uniref:hypothetical protein n=1 Tax=Secundilactobacillus similis TaxID=414682 RepID=UPI000B1C092D|nr:hypothetical protein [Secundilactobacillus similis]